MATESIHFSDHLKQIMRRMDSLVYERNMTELEIDRERLRRARALAAAAAELAMEADAPAQTADDAQRRAFSRHARALASAAARLDEIAAAGDYGALASQMRVVEDQCAACHQRFGVRAP